MAVTVLVCAVTLQACGVGRAAQQFDDSRGNIVFALAGDAVVTRALSEYEEPAYLELVTRVREATVAFANLEVLFHDYEEDVIPAAASGGTYMRADPRLTSDLAWFGLDMLSLANNHTMDFGAGGARRTVTALESAGLVYAGFGENLALARQPSYLDSRAGRVGLIAVASTFPDGMRAGAQRPDLRGRPGLNPLRHQTTVSLTAAEFDGLRSALRRYRPTLASRTTITFGGVRFQQGSPQGVSTVADSTDLAALVEAVREASRQAAWVIVSSHSHEGKGNLLTPADFLVAAARATIDAGADVFVAHGPHVLRGIEIYNGRPIFYSLGNFVFQNETVERQPADNYDAFGLAPDDSPGRFQDVRITDMGPRAFPLNEAFWESVVPIVRFENGDLVEVELHPITLGFGLPRHVRGRPQLANGAEARRILSTLADLSKPFGTSVEVRRGVGRVRLQH